MQRSLVVALLIGLLAGALVIAAEWFALLAPVEAALASVVPGMEATTRVVSRWLHYAVIAVLALGGAWLAASSARRGRLVWPLAVLVLELAALGWICALFGVEFQPLPSILALVLGFALASAVGALRRRSRSGVARDYFHGRVSPGQYARIATGEIVFEAEARSFETTTVVCDIGNKHDLAEECSPEVLAEITERFIAQATDSFQEAGAYVETASGEGIVAHFGFPGADPEQAERATRHALALLESFAKRKERQADEANFSVHLGISSGVTIFAPLQNGQRPTLLSTGEPVELARRFCIANRFYGSRVLIGPRTFEMTSAAVVARPIDFLSGVDTRERHEIYEPLTLAAEATPEEIARRDAFWNGVVLYREKRWAEAYSQFQKARGPNDYEDAPLQLYLRRLEPLALHLVESPEE